MSRFLRLALVLVSLLPGAALARAGTAAVPTCPAAVDAYVLTGSNIQGDPAISAQLTCYYTPGPTTNGPQDDVTVSWVTVKAPADDRPFYSCGQQPADPATAFVSRSFEAYAGIASAVSPGFPATAKDFLHQVEGGLARPCPNTVAAPEGSGAADTTPPTVTASTSYGPRTARLRLAFAVKDDSGRASVSFGVYSPDRKHLLLRGGPTRLVSAQGRRSWFALAPRALPVGTYEFCVVAEDEAGNRSRPSCATLDVRA